MNVVGAIIGAAIATAIGMVVWVGVGMAGYEVGFIAWGIGFAAGLGATVGAGKNNSVLNGVLAALIAVVGIVGAKYITISMSVDRELSTLSAAMDVNIEESDMISREANQFIEAEGKDPDAIYDDNTDHGFPEEYWRKATAAWNARTDLEKQNLRGQAEAEMQEFQDLFGNAMGDSIKSSAFKDSFSPFDALWFFLAAASAFRVGSGAHDG